MKIVFWGTPQFVQPIKNELAKHFTLTESLGEADMAVIAAYGKILTKKELNTPKFGCINVHPSLLPKYRGPSPIQQTILDGEKKTGISIIKMDEQVDHGPIIYQEQLDISDKDNFNTLSKKLFLRAAEILPRIIKDFVSGKIKPIPQNHTQATFTKLFTRKDGYFDINNPPDPQTLDRMIRAYYPWPGVWTRWNNKIVKLLPKGLIQMEGKKPISLKDFLNGYPDFPLKSITLDKK